MLALKQALETVLEDCEPDVALPYVKQAQEFLGQKDLKNVFDSWLARRVKQINGRSKIEQRSELLRQTVRLLAHLPNSGLLKKLQRAHNSDLQATFAAEVERLGLSIEDKTTEELRLGQSWSDVPDPLQGRDSPTVVLLADGRVLVCGGNENAFLCGKTLASAEIWDPRTNRWSAAGKMSRNPWCHSATLLKDGRLLVCGGWIEDGRGGKYGIKTAELFDPQTNRWTRTNALRIGRHSHSATLLQDGRVLVSGGENNSGPLSSTEIWNPQSGQWKDGPKLNHARYGHGSLLLANGSVIVIGGKGQRDAPTGETAEIWSPHADGWLLLPLPADSDYRYGGTSLVLPNGTVALLHDNALDFWLAETVDQTNDGVLLHMDLPKLKGDPNATLLPDGSLLIVSREDRDNEEQVLRYNPQNRRWQPQAKPGIHNVSWLFTLPDGRVFAFNGHVASVWG